jgi:hypothetical protein
VLLIAIALYQGYKGVTRKFLDEDKTETMGRTTKHWITIIGVSRPPRPDGRIRADRRIRAQGGH